MLWEISLIICNTTIKIETIMLRTMRSTYSKYVFNIFRPYYCTLMTVPNTDICLNPLTQVEIINKRAEFF